VSTAGAPLGYNEPSGPQEDPLKIHTLDLQFRIPGTVAAYLVESNGELALIETGPDSTYPNLVQALGRLGVQPSDVRTVLVTHVHLDHAGAAFRLAQTGATIHVHPKGIRHMADPSKLLASATRIYRDRMAELWGTLESIPADQLKVTEDRQKIRVGKAAIEVVETPGHAIHHNAYFVEGAVFTGDVGGVALPGGPVLPPTPPPDIDLEAWGISIARLRSLHAEAIYPTHYGRHERVPSYLDELESQLHAWAGWIKDRLDEGKDEAAIVPEFVAWADGRLAAGGVPEADAARYRVALPFAMNVTGLVRYWSKKGEAA